MFHENWTALRECSLSIKHICTRNKKTSSFKSWYIYISIIFLMWDKSMWSRIVNSFPASKNSYHPPPAIFDHFHKIFLAPGIFCCTNIWIYNMSKTRTELLLYYLASCIIFINTWMWVRFMKKYNNLPFCQRLYPDQIQNTDGVDRFHQLSQS